ncbi:uncharacterized protein K444DRAFT_638207 [Hyaloscypha bicolor E]|uniref:Uncharacterized protein n=1 Tax=Hyaloscypha bicolor E TaxID=1095630 RepID=A0A2J6SJF9_9HELO|nr:uncharacterized protein K444DRAFT_638207 [Hyaloscypha bicolor E]PMD50908.1 hypothetical protein K444DRAFT_638207 [Hyaloscypha bicolor E]
MRDLTPSKTLSGAVYGLALRQKSDDSEVRWVKSPTPENYTATASLSLLREESNQSLAPSTAFNHSGGGASLEAWSSQRTGTYTGGPLLQSVETAIRQTQPVIGQDDAYPAEARREVRLPPTAELDPLFRWLNDFTLYDNDDPRSLQPSHNSATLLSAPDQSVRQAGSTEAAAVLRSQERQSPAAILSVDEDELDTLD